MSENHRLTPFPFPRMKLLTVLALSCSLLPNALAEQGGTFFLTDIEPLLTQQRPLWDAVRSSFDIHSVGDASRISPQDNRELAGTRIGPYKLWAKPKNALGAFNFQ